MPRILKSRFKKLLVFLLLAFIVVSITGIYAVSAIIFSIFVIVIINRMVERKIKEFQKPFSPYSGIRNVQYLVIGDLCNPRIFIPEGASYVAVLAPNRSLEAAFEVFRHTESILDEYVGTVVFACKIENASKGLTIFDMPFMAEVTILSKRLQKLVHRSQFPLLYEPWQSIKLLSGMKKKNWHEQEVPVFIKKFCEERQIKSRYYC